MNIDTSKFELIQLDPKFLSSKASYAQLNTYLGDKLQGTGWTKAEVKAIAWALGGLGPYHIHGLKNPRTNVVIQVGAFAPTTVWIPDADYFTDGAEYYDRVQQ